MCSCHALWKRCAGAVGPWPGRGRHVREQVGLAMASDACCPCDPNNTLDRYFGTCTPCCDNEWPLESRMCNSWPNAVWMHHAAALGLHYSGYKDLGLTPGRLHVTQALLMPLAKWHAVQVTVPEACIRRQQDWRLVAPVNVLHNSKAWPGPWDPTTCDTE